MIAVLLGALLGGLGFRLRGWSGFERLTGRGATTARLACWAIPMGAFAALALPIPWWGGVLVALALWAGSVAPWWGSLDLGRMDGDWIEEAALHALRGLVWVTPAMVAIALLSLPWWPLLAAGALCLPVYELAWRLRPALATEIGEVVFGAAIGAALGLCGSF